MTNRPGNDARGLDHELRELCSACAAVYRDDGTATLTAARGVPSAASTGTATEIPPRNIS